MKHRLKIKLKVLWSCYQILTKVGETYLQTYPRSVEKSLQFLAVVNANLDALGLPLGCAGLGGFESKLLFMMLAPVGVLVLVKLIGWYRRRRPWGHGRCRGLDSRRVLTIWGSPGG